MNDSWPRYSLYFPVAQVASPRFVACTGFLLVAIQKGLSLENVVHEEPPSSLPTRKWFRISLFNKTTRTCFLSAFSYNLHWWLCLLQIESKRKFQRVWDLQCPQPCFPGLAFACQAWYSEKLFPPAASCFRCVPARASPSGVEEPPTVGDCCDKSYSTLKWDSHRTQSPRVKVQTLPAQPEPLVPQKSQMAPRRS